MIYLKKYEWFNKPKGKYKKGDYVKIIVDDYQAWYKYPIGKIVFTSNMGLEYQHEPVYTVKLKLNDGGTLELQIREEYIERKATFKEKEQYEIDENTTKYNL